MKDIVNFFFEVGILSKTPRSGFHLLGSGEQSVAEHNNRVVFIGYTLALLEKNVDMEKVLKMCLLHDLAEGRVGDLNFVHQKYVKVDEEAALKEMSEKLPFGKDMLEVIEEYEKRESRESIIAKDADILEWVLSLKEQLDTGNEKSRLWLETAIKRLKTDVAKKIAEEIRVSDSDDWKWLGDKGDSWWINRGKEKLD